MKVTAADRQTWYDLAIQYTGYAWNAVAIAVANGSSPEVGLNAGRQANIPDELPVNRAVVDYYAAKGLNPATEQEENKLTLPARVRIKATGEAATVILSSNTSWILTN
jgi:hypothetical protein